MKTYKIIFFFILVYNQFCFSQNLTVNDLSTYCNGKNWEEVNQKLLLKGWDYFESKKVDSTVYNSISWSFKKVDYSEKAQGWIQLLNNDNNPEIVIYMFFNKDSYLTLKNSLLAANFKLINNIVENNEIISEYSNSKFELQISTKKITEKDFLNSSTTGYVVTLKNKNKFESKSLNISKNDYFYYKINNECYYKDENAIITVLIDDKAYSYGEEIKLNVGKHIIKEKFDFKSGPIAGTIFEDETSVILDNEKFEITISLNCACPFFYYETLEENIYGGELIRNQNSEQKNKYDNINIDKKYISNNTLNLLITEEKDEISNIDNVYLKINNEIIVQANSNDKNVAEKLMKNDNNFLVMKKNDKVEVSFNIPENIEIINLKLYSKGYYLTIKK